jgi:hypothetical protein
VLNKYTYIGVAAEEKDEPWIAEIKEAVEGFSTGPVADGLSSVIANKIRRMICLSSGKRQTQEGL